MRTLGRRAYLYLAVLLTLPFTVVAAESLPADVQSFIDNRQTCDHFRGEPWDPGDEPGLNERREFILQSINKYCTGTDKRLAELRGKYKDNPRIIERLRHYEDHVEAR